MKPLKTLNFYNRWYYPTVVAFTKIMMILIIAFIFRNTFPGVHDQYPWFWSWDTTWYLRIVRHGYLVKHAANEIQPTAFYPLYPLLIKVVYTVTHSSLKKISFAISNIAFWLALVYLYRFTLNEYDDRVAKYTIWLLIAFPTAFFFHCAYTESLNLLFLVLFFYFLQQGSWYKAMVAGLLASITHGFGLLLILPALMYLWINRRKFNGKALFARVLSLLIIPLGVFMYMIFLYIKTGSPFTFIYAHRFWHHKSSVPVWHIFRFLHQIYFVPPHDWPFKSFSNLWEFKIVETINGLFSLLMVFWGILMMTIYRKQFSLPIIIFYVTSVLLSISSGSDGRLDSFARYVLVLFPGFIVWAYSCRHKEYLFLGSFSLILPFNVILLGMFVTGQWIT